MQRLRKGMGRLACKVPYQIPPNCHFGTPDYKKSILLQQKQPVPIFSHDHPVFDPDAQIRGFVRLSSASLLSTAAL